MMKRLVVAPRSVSLGIMAVHFRQRKLFVSDGAFRLSENNYDWLGKGVYFWEYAPYRALEWARLIGLQQGEEPAVLGATIRLGNCVNLMDIQHHADLVATHDLLVALHGDNSLPKNTARGGNLS